MEHLLNVEVSVHSSQALVSSTSEANYPLSSVNDFHLASHTDSVNAFNQT